MHSHAKIALRAEGLGKQYRIGAASERPTNLREAVVRAMGAPMRALWSQPRKNSSSGHRAEYVWALQDVSFEVHEGEVLGIIGRNGAGKSTLLKILSRIVEPTVGTADVYGRVGSLLEVGTGFHPELTGRDNIYLNGSILGMDRRYIARQFDEIVEFSGVGAFIDTPVKRYSSGMYLRLAFAVAAHLEPEVLIVDEVLAVGDAEFQRKCIGRMSEVARDGRTVLFVSHNMSAVQRLCTRCILIDAGKVASMGDTGDVVMRYLASGSSDSPPARWVDLSSAKRSGSGAARFSAMRYASSAADDDFRAYAGGPLEIDVRAHATASMFRATLGFTLRDQYGATLLSGSSTACGESVSLEPGTSDWSFRIAMLPLRPGTYQLDLWLSDRVTTHDRLQPAIQLEVIDRDVRRQAPRYDPRHDGPVFCEYVFAPGRPVTEAPDHIVEVAQR